MCTAAASGKRRIQHLATSDDRDLSHRPPDLHGSIVGFEMERRRGPASKIRLLAW
jgi:hypothetical protein